MADYKELLRRAVEALPENNGASRRAVYEKARAALVGQLRAINPPLAARDITAHRLQLEDCIRQVEQEASEAVIAGLSSGSSEPVQPLPAPNAPVYFDEPPPPQPKAQPPIPMKSTSRTSAAKANVAAKAGGSAAKEPKPAPNGSIEDIIAAANAEQPATESKPQRSVMRQEAKPMGKPVPKLVTATRPHATIEAKLDSKATIEARPDDKTRPPVMEKTRPPVTAKVEKVAEEINEDEAPGASVPAPVKSRPNGRPVPSIVARAEAAKSRNSSAAFGAPMERGADSGSRRGPVLEPRRESLTASRGGQAVARQAAAEPIALFEEPDVGPAMSTIREVEEEPAEAQVAIDRAIATLDREAREVEDSDANATDAEFTTVEEAPDELPKPVRRNGTVPPSSIKLDPPSRAFRDAKPARNDARDNRDAKPRRIAAPIAARKRKNGREALESAFEGRGDVEEKRGISAVTIFLVVFVLLVVGAGGAAVWAWREGFINFDQMFGRGAPVQQQAAAVTPPVTSPAAAPEAPATGPGNTDVAAVAAPTAELKQDDRLSAEPSSQALPLVNTNANAQLTTDPTQQVAGNSNTNTDAAQAAQGVVDPASVAGSQSLLLEAQDNGAQGAVPFSGTVDWSKGTDEMGLPTLVGKANIPARNLGVDILIRKNSDPSLPASHLMEINFHVSDSFVGGSVAGLPGVLLKNEELVQGKPLVGASARVVGNSFLFALSASPGDITTNTGLLQNSKWMDLAIIYATGKRAIITLEKDDVAQKLFADVESAWTKSASN